MWFCAAFVVVCAEGRAQDGPRPATKSGDEATQKLFLANCAACHGATGDGQGTTVLERPARSFKDGGFSYGNTPEAILRTITFGIPGSLMPAFASGLKDEERRALARHVIALGPEQLVVASKDTVLVVHDKPLIVRGKLPPIIDGAPERPRGLLIGVPAGLTFEYRTDDVRLLGVRSGEFVDRRDWIGRGGDALQPLGQVVRAFQAGDPRAMFELRDDAGVERKVTARLVSTAVVSGAAEIAFDLVEVGVKPADERVARITEKPSAYRCALGAGWKRDIVVECVRTGGTLRVRAGPDAEAGAVWWFREEVGSGIHSVRLPDPKLCDLIAWRVLPDSNSPGPSTTWRVTSQAGIEGRSIAGQRHVLSNLFLPGVQRSPDLDAGSSVIRGLFVEVR